MDTRTLNPATFAESKRSNDDRRRRGRLETAAIGYLLPETADPASEPWEVRVHDLSRYGVGFSTSEKMQAGDVCRIRIGYGPMRLARRMRVTHCRAQGHNVFVIGAEFA